MRGARDDGVMSIDLSERRVLVTGASSGIGRATASALVDAGASVALVARSAGALDELAARLGDRATVAPADVGVPDDIAAAVRAAADRLGGLDAIVCSAGVVVPGGVGDTTPADWRAMFDVNVLGVLNTVHAALPFLRDGELADIVNLSSMSGRRRASVELGVYSASKFAVHVLSDSLREELAPDGVRVTIVSPGYVDTPIFDGVADPDQRADYQGRVAAMGLPAEVVAAQVVHALAQPPGVDLIEIAMMSTRQ